VNTVLVGPPTGTPRPEIRLLDAGALGLDGSGLRACARQLSRSVGSKWVSRSYRFPYALVAWHDRPVGVDLERIGSRDLAFAGVICTPDERADLDEDGDLDRRLTSLWSSKEALAKALGDARSYDPSRLTSPSSWPELRTARWQAAPLEVPESHIGWVCWRRTDDQASPGGAPRA
jgi:phosphopantetheinyl transferase